MRFKFFKPIFFIFFVFQLSFSQKMPIDFVSEDNFTAFGGALFSKVSDPSNVGNIVGKIENFGISWEGVFLDLSRPINLDFQKVITLSFYSFDSNSHNIILKLENGLNADVEVIKSISSLGWTHDITFDFSNATYSGTSNPVNAEGTYNKITIFVDEFP